MSRSKKQYWSNTFNSSEFNWFTDGLKEQGLGSLHQKEYYTLPPKIVSSQPYIKAKEFLIKANKLTRYYERKDSVTHRELKEMAVIIANLVALHMQLKRHFKEEYHTKSRAHQALERVCFVRAAHEKAIAYLIRLN